MFYETKIGKLSKVQKSNLLKGKSVRIKKGVSDVVYLSESQSKGLNKNSKLGKAYTIKFTPEQVKKNSASFGCGIISDLVGLVHPGVGKLASIAGLGMNPSKSKAKKCSGKGIVSDLIGLVHPVAGKIASIGGLGVGSDLADSLMFSAGVHNKIYKPRRITKGDGFLENLAKEAAVNLAKTAGKFAVDKSLELGGNYVKGKIEGMGRARKKATPAQLNALKKGRAIRDANRRGGALYAPSK